MKILLCLIIGLSCSSAGIAQTRNGGGPSQHIKSPYIINAPKPGEESVYAKFKTQVAFKKFTQILLKREVECGIRKSVQKNDTLMSSYYRLNLTNSKNECITDEEILSCIKNDEYKQEMEIIKEDPGSIAYIAIEFNIDFKAAGEIYHFFASPVKEKPDQ